MSKQCLLTRLVFFAFAVVAYVGAPSLVRGELLFEFDRTIIPESVFVDVEESPRDVRLDEEITSLAFDPSTNELLLGGPFLEIGGIDLSTDTPTFGLFYGLPFPQALAVHPQTGELFVHSFRARGEESETPSSTRTDIITRDGTLLRNLGEDRYSMNSATYAPDGDLIVQVGNNLGVLNDQSGDLVENVFIDFSAFPQLDGSQIRAIDFDPTTGRLIGITTLVSPSNNNRDNLFLSEIDPVSWEVIQVKELDGLFRRGFPKIAVNDSHLVIALSNDEPEFQELHVFNRVPEPSTGASMLFVALVVAPQRAARRHAGVHPTPNRVAKTIETNAA